MGLPALSVDNPGSILMYCTHLIKILISIQYLLILKNNFLVHIDDLYCQYF